MNHERWEGQAEVTLFDGLTIAAHVVRHHSNDGRWFAVATIDAVVAVSAGDTVQCAIPGEDPPLRGVVTNVTTHPGVSSPRATSIRFEDA